jgi:hypothetical protein
MEKTKVSNNRLIKSLLISGLFILILIILSLFYLSNYGIKTSKFNKLILDRLIEVDSRISAEIEDVFLKLNLGKKEIKVITKNTNLYLEKNLIKLSEINLDIDLLSFLNNKAAIKTLKIETKKNSIKNLTNFVSKFKFHPSFLFFNRIEKGYIITKAKINFDDKGKIYPNYLISGKITQAKFKLLNNDRVNNINFNFSISDDEYNLKEINLEYLKTKINSETIKVIKKNKTYSVEGNIKNKKNPIDLKKLLSLGNIKFDLIDDKEIEIESDNNFAFTIDEKRKINDLKITSNLKFDKLYFNEKYQNLIYLQNGTIETEYYKNNLSLYFSSKYSFTEDEDLNIVNDKNDLNLHIVKKNNEDYVVEGSFKNRKKSIDPKDIFDLLKVENEFLSDEKITIETDNKFAFKIDEKQKVKDLSINSNLKFDKLFFNENYHNLIYLEDGSVETSFFDNNFTINLDSKYSFIEDENETDINNKDDIKLYIVKNNKDYVVEGSFKNKKKSIDPKALFKLANIEFDLLADKKISIESDNNFAFKIDEKRKINDLKITSNLKFDKLFFNEDYHNLIYLEDGSVETNYSQNDLSIEVFSKYSFIEDENETDINNKDDIKLHIVKKNNEDYVVEGSFKNKKKSIDPKDLLDLFKVNFEFLSEEEITIETNNKFAFKIDEKRKINDLKITSNLKFEKLVLNYNSSKIKDYLKDYKDSVYLKDGNVDIDYSKKLISIKGNSQYSLDKKFDNLEFDILKNNNDYKFNVNIDINNSSLRVDEIKYVKEKNSNSSLIFKGSTLNSNTIVLDKILFTENNNNFEINQIKFNDKYKVLSIDKLVLDYDNSNKIKNNIRLSKIDNNYILEGHSIDFSKYLNHILTSDEDKSFFSNFKNLNSILNINIKKVYLDNQNYLVNLNGKFNFANNKIENANLNSKFKNGDKFLFSIKSTNNNETVTMLYSDRAKPFVSNYKFIKGFKDGVIDFHSIKKNNVSKSVLKIDNFKVKEVPVLAKLLTLASLQGVADSLTGEGIRFTDFEMVFSNEDKLMTIDEIYSIGPAISILMEGYVVKNELISLKGTLVPATTINRTIASIPVIGDFLIGKKVGEGVFGVSFKIKGPPKNLKTTVNPVKTLTPRFITRTLEKIKRN